MPLVYVDGELLAEQDARISVFDHGLVVGDGVFETVLLHDGHAFALTRHLERIARSAAGLGLGALDLDALRAAIGAVVATAEEPEGRIRITVTAGRGPLGSGRLDTPHSVVVALAPLGHDEGAARVVVVPWLRNERGALTGLKTTSYAENARALAWAAERGGDEAIFANTVGALCEGTGSNVFVVRAGELVTPPLASGCLAGVTRALVLERFGGVEREIPIGAFAPDELDEAFLTSTLRGVQPVATIDGAPLAACPGPVTARAAAAFAALLADEVDP